MIGQNEFSAGWAATLGGPLCPEHIFSVSACGGRNVFLTGMAGTGKSTLLRQFMGIAPRRVDVTAPTGVAALNVGGMTLHRFCGMLLGPGAGESNEEYFGKLADDTRPSIRAGFRRVRACEVLVVDEISMLPGRQFEFVEFLFRRLRGSEAPFGGVQLICIGDFLQLPPVRTDDATPYDWAFASPAWERAGFKSVVLDTVRRQDEKEFVRSLGNFRLGRIGGDDATLLQSRVKHFPSNSLVRLCTHNLQVDKWNVFQLGELPGNTVGLEAELSGPPLLQDFLMKNLLTPAHLELKRGAMVMFTVNRTAPGQAEPLFVNGQVGVVDRIEDDAVFVRVRGGGLISCERFTWRYGGRDGESGAEFKQFPLRLAWAMTIHKAQGITLDAAYIDIRAARDPGQAYVAVSRVRTLAGLHFKSWFKGVFVSQDAVRFYQDLV